MTQSRRVWYIGVLAECQKKKKRGSTECQVDGKVTFFTALCCSVFSKPKCSLPPPKKNKKPSKNPTVAVGPGVFAQVGSHSGSQGHPDLILAAACMNIKG